MPRPPVRELSEIADGIATLARRLVEARAIQERLARDLAQQERLAALGRVVAGVAHEVRNPLASIKLRLDLAMAGDAAHGARRCRPRSCRRIAHASAEITRLDRLVADLLIVSGRALGPARIRTDVGALLRARVEALAPWSALRGVTIRDRGRQRRVPADGDAMARALDNLLRNAVEASPDGGTIAATVYDDGARRARARRRTPAAGFRPGASASCSSRSSRPSRRAPASGLAISRAIARAHGGDVIYARDGDVTRFELTPGTQRGGTGPGRGAARMSTVLIVEDEPGLRQGLCDVVERDGPVAGRGGGDRRGAGVAGHAAHRLRAARHPPARRRRPRLPARAARRALAGRAGDRRHRLRRQRAHDPRHARRRVRLPDQAVRSARCCARPCSARSSSARSSRAAAPLPASAESAGGLIGTSAAMLGVWKLIGRAAASTAPVLITGETGTGKELVARAIHSYSARAAQPFVPINLAALPPTLIESELFGHERGAFTGATGRRAGRFETAGDGTLFLDEIGDLDLALQTKLLRCVQEGTFERVGGDEALRTRARIIAATNRPVRPGTTGATLREDLYYRLAVIEIEVPPLRARRSDIPLLVEPRAARDAGARGVGGGDGRPAPRTTGPATCASCSTSSSARPCCAAAR